MMMPDNTMRGAGSADAVALSVQTFVDKQVAEGKTPVEAVNLALNQFGGEKFDRYALRANDGTFGPAQKMG